MFSFGLRAFPNLEFKSPTNTSSHFVFHTLHICCYLCKVPLYLLHRTLRLWKHIDFSQEKYFAPRSPGTLIDILSSQIVSLITSIMSHNYYLTRTPTRPAPLFLLSCPFLFSPIHAYSPIVHLTSPPFFLP